MLGSLTLFIFFDKRLVQRFYFLGENMNAEAKEKIAEIERRLSEMRRYL